MFNLQAYYIKVINLVCNGYLIGEYHYNFKYTFENVPQIKDGTKHINQMPDTIASVLRFPDCRKNFRGWQIAKYL